MGDAHGLPVERARRHRQFQKRQVFDPFDEFTSLLGITVRPRTSTTPTLTPTTAKTSSPTSRSSSSSTSKSSSSTVPTPTPTPTPTSTPTPKPSSKSDVVSIGGSFTPPTSKAPIPTGTSDSSNTKTDNSTGGIPTVAIGIIGAVAGVVLIVIAFLVVRKIRISKRREARSNWSPPIIEPLEKPSDPAPAPIPPVTYNQFMPGQGSINKPLPSGPAYPAPAVGYSTQPTYAGYAQPPYQPPSGYAQQPQSNANIFASSAYAPTDLAGPVPIARTTPPPPPPSSYISVVKRTFIPSLPDELSISTGESVRVLASYDDGWALCEKITNPGEKGVVPLECLGEAAATNPSNTLQPTPSTQEGARLSRRASSLNPAQPGHY